MQVYPFFGPNKEQYEYIFTTFAYIKLEIEQKDLQRYVERDR